MILFTVTISLTADEVLIICMVTQMNDNYLIFYIRLFRLFTTCFPLWGPSAG